MTTPNNTKTYIDPATHRSGFVTSNGVRLNYLDWGGPGPALILISGAFSNPHIFDDLSPAFTDRFRVVAYARRGHGQSEAKEPYDTSTLTEDLRGLMDGLGITKAHLAGWSMGGNEITAMAGTYPERVDRIVYLDAAYDWADPEFAAAWKAEPLIYNSPAPASAMKSIDAYLAHYGTTLFPGVGDTSRFEASLRDTVDIQPDGTVRERMGESVVRALITAMVSPAGRRDYTKVRLPALAIHAATFHNVTNGSPAQIAENLTWEHDYWAPFQATSIDRALRELHHAEIVMVPGTHYEFFFTSRAQVVAVMRKFLLGPGAKPQ
jgi:pimeloyl-ACP methyl ester carboxylesterase